MTIKNTPNLEDIAKILDEASSLKDKAKILEAQAQGVLSDLYNSQLETKLKAKPEPYGTVNTVEDGFKIAANVEKKVTWDQDILARLYESLDKPDEYIKVEFSLSEAKYKAWPSDIQQRFIKARTVKPGNMKITLTKKDSE